ncbi:MAG: GTP cyclohydrolase I FolE [Bilifractor sp.]|nr:GTP cyclohydrolase I FolE [Lachnospiraceae bacterium]MDY2838693.1 GTP cyclohydrolase I FolE [Bilifractor sp.]
MIDKVKVEQAVRLFLEGIGEDPDREGLLGTPDRIARMCEEIFAGTDEAAQKALSVTFSSPADNLVLEKDIQFYSVCEHHLLPFFGNVHIAYLPNGKVAGLSKLARTVEAYARRAQIQEKLTDQIATAVMENLDARGVMVVIEAEHLCMSMRGIKKPGTRTMTYVCKGAFENDPALVDRVLAMIRT